MLHNNVFIILNEKLDMTPGFPVVYLTQFLNPGVWNKEKFSHHYMYIGYVF